MESRREDVSILSITDSREIGLKLEGSSVLPFLWMRIVQAFFHSEGIEPVSQMMRIISVNRERKYGHLLKDMIEIWSRGLGDADDFMRRTIAVIFDSSMVEG